ncbi:MAG: calcium-binding protein [Terricaulis sp.]
MNSMMRIFGAAVLLSSIVAACGQPQREDVGAPIGGPGDDALLARPEVDAINGGEGIDVVDYSRSDAGVIVRLWKGTGENGYAQGDTYSQIENANGSPLADSLVGADNISNRLDGGAGDDSLSGLSGDDTIVGGPGADRIDGGAGSDTADYSGSDAGVIVRVWNGTGEGGDAQGDRLTNVENVTGSGFADSLIGADGVENRLDGNAGNDSLFGLSGDDTLNGGLGADRLNGGAGADIFVLKAGEANGDVVIDFASDGPGRGDVLSFVGYGTVEAGATITRVNSTHWRVSSADGQTVDTITIANGASLNSNDYRFVDG